MLGFEWSYINATSFDRRFHLYTWRCVHHRAQGAGLACSCPDWARILLPCCLAKCIPPCKLLSTACWIFSVYSTYVFVPSFTVSWHVHNAKRIDAVSWTWKLVPRYVRLMDRLCAIVDNISSLLHGAEQYGDQDSPATWALRVVLA